MSGDDFFTMTSFNPSKPAKLYDELNDRWLDYDPKYRRELRPHDKRRGTLEWDGLIISGWRLPD